MISEIRSTLFQRFLQRRFGAGKRFTRAYIKYFEKAQAVSLRSARDWQRLDTTRRMWFDFALSTNQRGKALVHLLRDRQPMKGKRYLDIGCGFGGTLVAGARAGAACTGIEIDPIRMDLAWENLEDFRVAAPILKQDALAPDLPDRLGQFDFISLSDVVEHVLDATQLFRNLGLLLAPGGLLYVQIPNPDSVEFVAADGHFGLFGITLLPREDAIDYHGRRFQFDYDVGDYYSLDECLHLFDEAGLHPKLIPSLHHPARRMTDLESLLASLTEARRRFAEPDPALHEKLANAYEDYLRRLHSDRARLTERDFRNRYLRNFWTFLASPK